MIWLFSYVCMYVCMYESICNAPLLQPKQSRQAMYRVVERQSGWILGEVFYLYQATAWEEICRPHLSGKLE